MIPKEIQDAYIKAKHVRGHAYAPYSKFYVGSALKPKNSDAIFTGCNVENSSYGGTVCAERVALHTMVAALGNVTLEWVIVVTDISPPAPPCGLCLQSLGEFADDDTMFYLSDLNGIQQQLKFKDLLPHHFHFKDVKK